METKRITDGFLDASVLYAARAVRCAPDLQVRVARHRRDENETLRYAAHATGKSLTSFVTSLLGLLRTALDYCMYLVAWACMVSDLEDEFQAVRLCADPS